MAYKRYIKKNGKLYGPYYYKSRKVNGKVVSEYVGHSDKSNSLNGDKKNFFNKKYLSIFMVTLLGILLVFLLFYGYQSFTARSIINIETSYEPNETIKGNIFLNLREGELIPGDTLIYLKLGSQEKSFLLSELIDEGSVTGDFYAENAQLSGSGEGYGLPGKMIIYPEFNFSLKISKGASGGSSGSAGEGDKEIQTQGEEVVPEEIQEEQPEEVPTEEADEELGEEADQPAEDSGEVVEESVDEAPSDNSDSDETQVPEEVSSDSISDSSEANADTGSSESSSSDSSDESGESSSSDSGDGSDSGSDSSVGEVSTSPITGGAIRESANYEIIKGIVSKDNPYQYSLGSGERAEISESDHKVDLDIEGDIATVSTDYSEEVDCFGEECLGEGVKRLEIDIEMFNFTAIPGNLIVEGSYGETVIVSANKEIKVEGEENKILDESGQETDNENSLGSGVSSNISFSNDSISNYTPNNETNINQTQVNGSILNDTIINATISNESISNLSSVNYTITKMPKERIVIGRPVVWVANITVLNDSINENIEIEVEIPKEAKNISIKKKDNEKEEEIDKDNIKVRSLISGQVSAEIDLDNDFSFIGWLKSFFRLDRGISGRVIEDIISENVGDNQSAVLVINESATEFIIEYETPAPQAVEDKINNHAKQVVVSADDYLNYTDILAYSYLDNEANDEKVKIYHLVDNARVLIESDKYDLNGNGLVDYLEWNVEHLSNQTYIIVITSAEHLDENKTFISDIYDLVKEQDGNWTNTINNSQYIRVNFEENLTKDNDITVYARAVNGSGDIGVYLKNRTDLVAEINNISEEGLYKTYLTNLGDITSSEFDLRINSSYGLEFDLIIDPTIILSIASDGNPTNITLESTAYHLTISSGSPYENLVLYLPFDDDYNGGNETTFSNETEQATGYDGAIPTNPANAYDGDWNTYAVGTNTNFYFNYSNEYSYPHATLKHKFQVEDDGGYNDEVTAYCWNYATSTWQQFFTENYDITPNVYSTNIPNNCLLSTNPVQIKYFLYADWEDPRVYETNITYFRNTTYDYSSLNNDASYVGNPGLNSSSVYGQGYTFDATDNEYLSVPDSNTLEFTDKTFTLMGWAKIYDDYNTKNMIIKGQCGTNNPAYILAISGNDPLIRVYNSGGSNEQAINASSDLSLNSWHHIAGVANSSDLILYIDGQFSNKTALTLTMQNLAYPTDIGAWRAAGACGTGSTAWEMNGTLDEIMIFNDSLTAEQVFDIYSNNSARFKNPGILEFKDIDVSGTGRESFINLSVDFYQNYSGSNVSVYINGGEEVFLNSSGGAGSLEFSTSPSYINITFKFYAGNNYTSTFYSPLVEGLLEVTSNIKLSPPLVDFVSPTPGNGIYTNNRSIEINASINENSLDELIFNWNGTNYTYYNDSLILFYNFDNRSSLGENDSSILDLSSYQNNGSWQGNDSAGSFMSGVSSDCKYGNCYYFDGEGDYINVSNEMSFDFDRFSNFSGCAWIKPYDNNLINGVIMSKVIQGGPGWEFSTYDGSDDEPEGLNVYMVNDFGSGNYLLGYVPNALTYGVWQHVCFSYSGTSNVSTGVKLYYNAQEQPVTVYNDGLISSILNNWPLQIGKRYTSTQPFNGSMDEVMVWNRTLTGNDIQQLYFSNLYKYNQTQWYLYVNQSKNSTDLLDDGNYTYFVSGKDSDNSENITETRSIFIDYSAPNITDVTPGNATISGEAEINFTANVTDSGSGIANATLYIYNETGLYNMTFVDIIGAPLTISIGVVVAMVEGVYHWFWEVFDAAANSITSQDASTGVGENVTLTVDPSNPLISYGAGTSGNKSIANRNSIYVNVSVVESNEDTISFALYNGTILHNISSFSDGTRTINWTGLVNPGNYTFNVTINDSLGNVNSTSPRFFALGDSLFDCMTIAGNGSYTLENSTIVDYNGNCIQVNNSNVVFDGNYYTVDGIVNYGITGIFVYGSSTSNQISNVTVKNVDIGGFGWGIYYLNVNSSYILDFNVNDTKSTGIYLYNTYDSIVNNFSSNSSVGYSTSSGLGISSQTGIDRNNVSNGVISGNSVGISFGFGAGPDYFSNLTIQDNVVYGLELQHIGTDNHVFYNNVFNNSQNVYRIAGAANQFNTTLSSGTNIINGSFIGGNYYTSPSGYNYSDVCSDHDRNGICDAAYNTIDGTACPGCFGDNIDSYPLARDGIIPNISFAAPTPDNGATVNYNDVYINVSTSDSNNHSAFLDWNRSLVLWMNFDNNNGTDVFDNSTWGNNGSVVGSAVYNSSGVRGGAWSFDGESDYILLGDPSDLNITGNMTISAWIYANDIDGTQSIIGKSDAGNAGTQYEMFLSNGDLRFRVSYGTATAQARYSNGITAGSWYHVVGILNETGNLSVYVNGIRGNIGAFLDGVQSDSFLQAPTIGAIKSTSPLYYFNGSIDEVMIFSRALSDQEIKSLYQAGMYRLENNFTDLENGNYTYKAYAIDSYGNINQTGLRSVNVFFDTTYPLIGYGAGTSGNKSIADRTSIYVNVSVVESNEDTISFALYNGSILHNISSFTGGTRTINWTGLVNPGNYTFNVTINDSLGNVNSTTPRFFALGDSLFDCMTIAGNGSYVLVNSTIINHASTCFQINNSNVVFDGNGYTVDGDNNYNNHGIFVSGTSEKVINNLTIKNFTLTKFDAGVLGNYFQNSTIENINSYSKGWGLHLQYSFYNFIKNVSANTTTSEGNRGYGIKVYSGSYNNFTNGTLTNNALWGLYFVNSYSIVTGFNISSNPTDLLIFDNQQNNLFYNNIIGNLSISNLNTNYNYFNTTLSSGTNIIGGSFIGGNFYVNSSGYGYSEICVDSDNNKLCDVPYNVSSQSSCIGCSGDRIDKLPLASDVIIPNISFASPTPDNGDTITYDSVYLNVSTSDINNHSAFIDWNRSLVLWMNFDSNNGTDVFDNSSYGRNGTVEGGAVYNSSGARGGGWSFDGVDDLLNISDGSSINFDIGDNFTISAWIFKHYKEGSSQAIISKYNPGASYKGFVFSSTSAAVATIDENALFFDLVGTWSSDTIRVHTDANSLPDNQWHHVAVVYNGGANASEVKLYIDGLNMGNNVDIDSLSQSTLVTDDVHVGEAYDGDFFNGTLDEVLVFSRALSPEEINASYQAGMYRLERNFTNLGNGNYTYKVWAIDSYGNINSSNLRSVDVDTVLDTTYPLISYGAGTSGNKSIANKNSIYVNVSVNETNEDTITFALYNGTILHNISSFTGGTRTINWTGLVNPGNYTFNVTINDTAGNVNSTSPRFFALGNELFDCMTIVGDGSYSLINSTIVNYASTCIQINNSNVIFDGQGYTVDGIGGWSMGTGVIIGGKDNITINNIKINDFTNGVLFDTGTNNSRLMHSLVTSWNGGLGFGQTSDNLLIENNTIMTTGGNQWGITMSFGMTNNNFTSNIISGNIYGIRANTWTGSSSNNIFRDNQIVNNTIGISFTHFTNDFGTFYNNYFNNSLNNIEVVDGADNFFNITLQAGTNILGDSFIGGNYYANYSGTVYSEICSDHDRNGICDIAYNVSSNSSCAGCTGYGIDELPLASDGIIPNISFAAPTPDNGATVNYNDVYINVSTSDANNHSAFLDWNRSLALWVNFDDRKNETYIYDNSSYGRNGTVVNGSINSSGARGDSISFTSQGNDGIIVNSGGNNDLNPNKNFTASFWIKNNYPSQTQTVFSRIGTNHVFYFRHSDNQMFFRVYNTSADVQPQTASGVNSISDNNWHHIVGGFNGSQFIYLDGTLKQTASVSGDINNGSGQIDIGRSWLAAEEMNGSIDEVMVFSRALSNQEIKSLYQAGMYRLENNFTDLEYANYTYQAYAIDSYGNINQTNLRSVEVSDPSVLTSCQDLSAADTVYTLNGPVTSTTDCFNITAENVTLDCQNWGNKIYYGNQSSTTVYYGIFSGSNSSKITNCEVLRGEEALTTNQRYGIYLTSAGNTIISNSNFSKNWRGAYILNAINGNITNSTFSGNSNWGLGLAGASASDNWVYDVRVYGNSQQGITATGQRTTISNIVAFSNSQEGIVVGSPYMNVTDITAYSNLYGVRVNAGVANVFISNVTAYLNTYGIAPASGDTVFNVNASSNTYGLYVSPSTGVNVTGAVANKNTHGVYIYNGADRNILENITVIENTQNGVYISSSTDGNRINNLNSILNGQHGVSIGGSSTNNSMSNFYIANCSSSGNYACLYLNNKHWDFYIENGTIENVSTSAIYFYGLNAINSINNSVFKNININNANISVYVTDYTYNLSLINVSYDLSNETVNASGNTGLYRKWHYRIYVNDTNGNPVSGAVISAYNLTGSLIENFTTNPDGYSNLSALVDYFSDGSRSYYSLYDINVSKTGYQSNNKSLNVTLAGNYLADSITLTSAAGPNITGVKLESLDGTNLTTIDLNCSAVLVDDGDAIDVSVNWYLNTSINLTIDYNNSYANGTKFYALLGSGNTTKNEQWMCSLRAYDGTEYSSWYNSSNLTILNSAPTITADNPPNNNITTDRTPGFNWTGSDDDAGDALVYDFNLTCYPACSFDNRHVTDITDSYYIVASDLRYLSDNNFYYNWSVRVYDGQNYSQWTSPRRIEIQSLLDLTIYNVTVDFGSLNLSQSDNTTDGIPSPIRIENSGNSFANITINASSLFSSALNPTNNFRFKIGNESTENGSFYWDRSITVWTDMPLSPLLAISELNYSDATDMAVIDILINVPADENPGNKSSTIIFISSLGE